MSFFFVSCTDKEEESLPAVEILDLPEAIFQANNSLAVNRLRSISFGEADKLGGRKERFKMVHISDSHLSSWSVDNHYKNPINLIHSVRFANQPALKINAMVATGDFMGYSTDKKVAMDYMRSFVEYFHKGNYIPSVLCTGNHDNNYLDDKYVFTRAELNSLLFSTDPNRGDDRSENYYYLDVPNPQGGFIRFISLDMIDHPSGKEYDALHYVYYSQRQITWLGEVALKKDMTPQHSVVVLNHIPFEPTSSGGATSYFCDGYYVHTWQMVPEIIEAFRSRTPIKKIYPNTLGREDRIHVDFNFEEATGEFVCHMGGHAHVYACFDIKTISNENPDLVRQKMILCNNQSPTEIGVVYNRTPRENRTVSSNSFSIYAIDTQEKKVYITFFGAYLPSDNPTFSEVQSFSYN
ncbi:metallophosphoesterase [Parabacteroides sp. 52]|nr:metallophosphoesterase [Parabacteroides sp. 52]